MSDGAETAVGDLLGEELDLSLFHLESLLDERGQLPNALGLVSEHILGARGQDDDLSSLGRDADFSEIKITGLNLNESCNRQRIVEPKN